MLELDWTAFFLEIAETQEHCVVVVLLVVEGVVLQLVYVDFVVLHHDVPLDETLLLLHEEGLPDDKVVDVLHADFKSYLVLSCLFMPIHLIHVFAAKSTLRDLSKK